MSSLVEHGGSLRLHSGIFLLFGGFLQCIFDTLLHVSPLIFSATYSEQSERRTGQNQLELAVSLRRGQAKPALAITRARETHPPAGKVSGPSSHPSPAAPSAAPSPEALPVAAQQARAGRFPGGIRGKAAAFRPIPHRFSEPPDCAAAGCKLLRICPTVVCRPHRDTAPAGRLFGGKRVGGPSGSTREFVSLEDGWLPRCTAAVEDPVFFGRGQGARAMGRPMSLAFCAAAVESSKFGYERIVRLRMSRSVQHTRQE